MSTVIYSADYFSNCYYIGDVDNKQHGVMSNESDLTVPTDAGNQPSISRLTTELPPFCRSSPEKWFSEAEYQFQLAGITQDNTKYNDLLVALDESLIPLVQDIILDEKNKEKYKSMKSRLIETYQLSYVERIIKLVDGFTLGDRRPSELLKEMQSVAPDDIPEELIQALWLRLLPHNVRLDLCSVTDNLEESAKRADASYKLNKDKQEILAAMARKTEAAMSRITEHVNRKPLTIKQDTPKICFYHRKFGTKAKKCILPCSFGKSN